MRKLYRSRYDRILGGVCGGIGHMVRLDPTIIRLLLIFICLLTGILPVVLIYLLSCLIIPLEPANAPAFEIKRFYRSKSNRVFAGICGGLSDMLRIDATVLRLVFIVVTFVTAIAPMLIAYVIGWIIIPEES